MLKQVGLIAAVVAGVVSSTHLAQAQPAPVEAAAPGARTHDGFFFRIGLNFGVGSLSNDVTSFGEESISGFALGNDFLFGGTPVPGLVIGGGLMSTYGPKPKYELAGVERELDGTLYMFGLAGFVQYYIDPHEGFHIQAFAGYGALDFVTDAGQSGGNDPHGPFFGGGLGYDFWVGDQWSIGPFGRVLYGTMSAEGSDSVSYLYPSIGAAFTLH